jgi:hypothetical protein
MSGRLQILRMCRRRRVAAPTGSVCEAAAASHWPRGWTVDRGGILQCAGCDQWSSRSKKTSAMHTTVSLEDYRNDYARHCTIIRSGVEFQVVQVA